MIIPFRVIIPTGVVILKNGADTVDVKRIGTDGTVIFDLPKYFFGGTYNFTVFYAGDRHYAPAVAFITKNIE